MTQQIENVPTSFQEFREVCALLLDTAGFTFEVDALRIRDFDYEGPTVVRIFQKWEEWQDEVNDDTEFEEQNHWMDYGVQTLVRDACILCIDVTKHEDAEKIDEVINNLLYYRYNPPLPKQTKKEIAEEWFFEYIHTWLTILECGVAILTFLLYSPNWTDKYEDWICKIMIKK